MNKGNAWQRANYESDKLSDSIDRLSKSKMKSLPDLYEHKYEIFGNDENWNACKKDILEDDVVRNMFNSDLRKYLPDVPEEKKYETSYDEVRGYGAIYDSETKVRMQESNREIKMRYLGVTDSKEQSTADKLFASVDTKRFENLLMNIFLRVNFVKVMQGVLSEFIGDVDTIKLYPTTVGDRMKSGADILIKNNERDFSNFAITLGQDSLYAGGIDEWNIDEYQKYKLDTSRNKRSFKATRWTPINLNYTQENIVKITKEIVENGDATTLENDIRNKIMQKSIMLNNDMRRDQELKDAWKDLGGKVTDLQSTDTEESKIIPIISNTGRRPGSNRKSS